VQFDDGCGQDMKSESMYSQEKDVVFVVCQNMSLEICLELRKLYNF
jgi:hypothetical protein